MIDRTEFKQGEAIILTEGEYSDYGIIGLFRVLKDFNTENFRDERPPFSKWHVRGLLYKGLVSEGYLEDIDHTELWVGR